MTLVARSVVGFVVESAAWVAIVALICLAVASPLWVRERTRSAILESLAWTGTAALVIASLVHRVDGPLGPTAAVGRRDLPVLWLAVGAAMGGIALVFRRRSETAP